MNVRALVGWNLRRLRVGRDLSQEALGLAADMEPSYIGRIERGRENATIETLDKLAALLREPVSAFFVVPPDGAKPPRALKPGRKPRASVVPNRGAD